MIRFTVRGEPGAAYVERAKGTVLLVVTFRDVQNIDDETRRNITQAFEAACDRLKLDLDDPMRGKLAREIIALVSIGERDPARLFTLAISAIDLEESNDESPI